MLVNYQGVARDAILNPIANQPISLKFEILQGSSTGQVVHTDLQPAGTVGVITNSLGLFTTQIGKNETLSQLNWQGGPYFLRASMNASGGTAYVSAGIQQMVSVPFALHAEDVPSTYTNNILSIGAKSYGINSSTKKFLEH